MWLVVKIAVKFWIPVFAEICILATLSNYFFFHYIILIREILKQMYFCFGTRHVNNV